MTETSDYVDVVPLSLLSPCQLEAYNKFKDEVSQWKFRSEDERKFCDERGLCRYLRARNYNVKKASVMLKETLDWRAEVRPQDITFDEVKAEAAAGSNYVHGFDKKGHPVIYMRVLRDTPSNNESKLKLILFNLEECIRRMDTSKGVEKFVFIVDMTGFKVSMSDDSKVGKQWSKILSAHYPERFYLGALVNAPRIFSALWTCISPFVDKKTKKKIQFIRGDLATRRAFFANYFDMNQLEADFGGELVFDHVTNATRTVNPADIKIETTSDVFVPEETSKGEEEAENEEDDD